MLFNLSHIWEIFSIHFSAISDYFVVFFTLFFLFSSNIITIYRHFFTVSKQKS
nr:MAG TPA: hypothetical protein [Caudoviricetes sp.]